jgi:hypothetical protein
MKAADQCLFLIGNLLNAPHRSLTVWVESIVVKGRPGLRWSSVGDALSDNHGVAGTF